ncbi:MAG TPA: helix-turn-helix domain-containing protein [Baekduia sp.]|nr:helix-turn-helix domain-containing protein [Baekduia sp.]
MEVTSIPAPTALRSARQQALLSIVAEHGQPITTTELSRITGETLGATAHHVRALARAGFIAWAGERRARGALQTFYVASATGRAALREPRVEALLTLFGAFVAPGEGRVAALLDLDAQARDELHGVIERLRPDVAGIVAGATRRSRAPRG